jgi:hypothetical protein
MMRLILVLAVLAAGLAVAGPSAAGELPAEDKSRPHSRVDFEGMGVGGRLKGPTVEYVPARKGARFESLIRVRQNFDPELHQSVDAL